MVAHGPSDFDGIAYAIAKTAHTLTGAAAAALATRTEGIATCRGRSGDLAPELGARLSVDSGISGECLRTGKVLRVDDTLKDFRADPEVCKRLGLRSIAAVPLRGSRGATGVLEAFSTRPFAFADEHMDALRQLAELAEYARAAGESAAGPVAEPVETHTAESQRIARLAAALANARAVASRVAKTTGATALNLLRNPRTGYVSAAMALTLLVVASLLTWKPWKSVKQPASAPAVSQAASSQPAAVSPEPAPTSPAAKAVLVWTPPGKPSAGIIKPAAKRDTISSELTDAVPKAVQPAQSSAGTAVIGEPPSTLPTTEAVILPGPSKALTGVLSATATIPQLGTPVSSGVIEGQPIRKVAPVYPQTAVPLRLEGAVVLRALITEDGKVRDVSVVSGHPMLVRAAIDAVKKWRYRPYLLNGKPVQMPTQITVNFKMP
jgi:protein TonB